MQVNIPNVRFSSSAIEHIFKAPQPGTLVDEHKGLNIFAHETVYKVRLGGSWEEFKNRGMAKRAINRFMKKKR